mmetsp:Transcript_24906/g.75808  ORF Transcript_24906/g.75808 Transcript_24906/m.75808 type:complete len:88 (-) Transcript_24906:71-334(-)|eukprot:scaffold47741_cov39-Tisochrysis_lutea.AAC.2
MALAHSRSASVLTPAVSGSVQQGMCTEESEQRPNLETVALFGVKESIPGVAIIEKQEQKCVCLWHLADLVPLVALCPKSVRIAVFVV